MKGLRILCIASSNIRSRSLYLIYRAWEILEGGKLVNLANCEPFVNFFHQLFPSSPCIGTMLAHSPIFYSPIDSD